MDESRIDTAPVGPSPEMLQCILEEVLDRRGGHGPDALGDPVARGTPHSGDLDPSGAVAGELLGAGRFVFIGRWSDPYLSSSGREIDRLVERPGIVGGAMPT